MVSNVPTGSKMIFNRLIGPIDPTLTGTTTTSQCRPRVIKTCSRTGAWSSNAV